MSSKDIVEGRGEQAVGMFTGTDMLREEGKIDQGLGAAKEATHPAVSKAKQASGHTMMKIFRQDQSHHSIGAT